MAKEMVKINFIHTNIDDLFGKLITQDNLDISAQSFCFLLDSNVKLSQDMLAIDQKLDGIITKFLTQCNSTNKVFCGKFGEVKILTFIQDELVKNIILLGIGNYKELKQHNIEELGGILQQSLANNNVHNAVMLLDRPTRELDLPTMAALVGSGAELSSYKFNKYLSTDSDHTNLQNAVTNIFIRLHKSSDLKVAAEAFQHFAAINEGVFWARDLTAEPANKLYPEIYAVKIEQQFAEIAKKTGISIEVKILDKQEMHNLGMEALLGVGQGSYKESRLVSILYHGADNPSAPPLALVGKGVTFDSGGLSLKPANSMEDMKYDMSGSASVVGTIKALALRKAKVNVVGVVALVENMPGGNAQRPGDVVKTMSGQTVEILNTDAEGRLILADALWYAQETFAPHSIIDLATLTGAIIVAVGYSYAGCFSNNNTFAKGLISAGEKVNEKLWHMPLHKDYTDMLKSNIADMANIANARGAAGSCTAASFLQKFIKSNAGRDHDSKTISWAHLDIASTAWLRQNSNICPKGAVGFGVRLINQFIMDNYETQS